MRIWRFSRGILKKKYVPPNKLGILAFQKKFNYQICIETLKTPQSLFQLHVVLIRNNQLYLRARDDDTPHINSRVNIIIWNTCIKRIAKLYYTISRTFKW